MERSVLFVVLCAFCAVVTHGQQHDRGFLKSPTARAAVWKYFLSSWAEEEDIKLSQNYDNLNCGGQLISKGQLDNNCGVCGDPYNGDRQNERPNGIYAYNRTTYVYREGATINVTVEITKRMKKGSGGYFIFKVCNRTENQDQQCFDDHVIPLQGGNSKPIPAPKIAGDIIVPLQLPQGLKCQFCTMQFTFITATVPHCNQGRKCTFGNEQEITIVNCADIQIISQQDEFPSEFLWPDYNSQYSSLHVGKTTMEPPPSTDKIIFVPILTTPSVVTISPVVPVKTTPSGITTTTEPPPSTAEKLVLPPVVVPPLVGAAGAGGGGGALAGAGAAALGGIGLLPMGLLFALGLLGGELNRRNTLSQSYGPFSDPLIDNFPFQTSYVAVGNPAIPAQMVTSGASTGTGNQLGPFSTGYSPFSIGMSRPASLSGQQGNLTPLSQSGGAQLIGEEFGYLETMQPEWVNVDMNGQNLGNQNGQGGGNVVNQDRWFPQGNTASASSNTGASTLSMQGQGRMQNPQFQNSQPITMQTMTQNGGQAIPQSFAGNMQNNGQQWTNSPQSGLMPASSSMGQMSVVQGNQFQNGAFSSQGALNAIPGPRSASGVISTSISVNGGLPITTTNMIQNGGTSGRTQFQGLPNSLRGINNGPTYVQSTAGGRFFELPNNYQTSNGGSPILGSRNTLARESQMSFGQGIATNMAGRVDAESGTLGEISMGTGTMLEFDREPAVRAQRKSPYSKMCKKEAQVCRPSYGKTPTLYGEVSIFGMICDIECSNGNPNCPAEICTCICPKLALDNILEEIQNILKSDYHTKNMQREKKARALLRKMKGRNNG